MLNATDVWFEYDAGRPVLRGISLAVAKGAIVGILGPNGSGKTTLLRILAGTRRPARGSIALDEVPLGSFSRVALARRLAVVPQETQLAFDYTVAEVAMMGRYPHLGPFEIEGPADVAIVDEALASTGTAALKDRLFATLSGGEKQRVIIAAALAQIGSRKNAPDPARPGVLLLDEPTASLDLGYQLEIAALLKELHERRQVTIVISTHDLSLAGSLCERIAVIRDGAVLAEGAADEVLTPEHIRSAYGVDAEVLRHESGYRAVIPVRRSGVGGGT
jgi:iron complex transport system ATP-binding protein